MSVFKVWDMHGDSSEKVKVRCLITVPSEVKITMNPHFEAVDLLHGCFCVFLEKVISQSHRTSMLLK